MNDYHDIAAMLGTSTFWSLGRGSGHGDALDIYFDDHVKDRRKILQITLPEGGRDGFWEVRCLTGYDRRNERWLNYDHASPRRRIGGRRGLKRLREVMLGAWHASGGVGPLPDFWTNYQPGRTAA